MTYYPEIGISDNDVAFAIAHLLLQDARVNNLMMPGFPSVKSSREGDSFQINFELNAVSSDKFSISTQDAKRICKSFKSQNLTSKSEKNIFDKIQQISSSFEGWNKFSI